MYTQRKSQALRLIGITLLMGLAALTAAAPNTDGNQVTMGENNMPLKASAEDMQWFMDAKFGMFVHWGPVSLTGKELSWARSGPRPGDIMGADCIPQEEYDQLFKRFNPVAYDADQWVKIARDAGMKYIVLTTKHHDGFSLFDTRLSSHSITQTPYRRDIVRDLADACHRANFKLGLYYSQRDWFHPDYLGENHQRYIDFMNGQVRELLTNYGKVDVMWFDSIGGRLDQWRIPELIRMIRELQPGILINNRAAAVLAGYDSQPPELNCDFDTPEEKIGAWQIDRPWESCITLVGRQWSYKPEGEMMSRDECIRTLVQCVGGGGNLLLNIGPMPTGEIEPRQVERLREIGDWLNKYGESIYDTQAGPFRSGTWGVSTQKNGIIYLHILDWPEDGVVFPGLGSEIIGCEVLTGGKVDVVQTEAGLRVRWNEGKPDPLDTIVKLRIK